MARPEWGTETDADVVMTEAVIIATIRSSGIVTW